MRPAGVRTPELTIVLAVWRGPGALDEWLMAVEPQLDDDVEVLAVTEAGGIRDLPRRPWIEWIEAPTQTLVPHLWALGIERARGRWVALATSRLVPADDWLRRLRSVRRDVDVAAIGGAIDPPPERASAQDWATFLLRYGAYLGRGDSEPRDLAGDNAAYRRSLLERQRKTWTQGFWEPEVHRRLADAGEKLRFVPEWRVRFAAGFGAGLFCRQRFSHGRRYGSDRLRGWRLPFRAFAALALPLIPPILVWRVVHRAFEQDGIPSSAVLRSLPWLGLFATAWALGEVMGYLNPLKEAPLLTDSPISEMT